MARVIEVSAGLIFREGRLLIAQRPEGTHLAGYWEFPGGKREDGETFEECLVRELREELGVEVSVGARIESIRHDYPGKSVRIDFFTCRLQEEEPASKEGQSLRWIQVEELGDFSFPDADAHLIERLKRDSGLWC